MKPYGIQSDSHHHNWSAFSHTTANGINNRLEGCLNEVRRLAAEVKSAGGNTIYHTGDLFHVRGQIAPSVLNPTLDVYRQLIEEGFIIRILAGNHDLEDRHVTRTGSAVTALEGIGCQIVNKPTFFNDDRVVMIPWIESVKGLKDEIEKAKKHIESMPSPPPLRSMESISDWTLMIHAPVDGVIAGLPEHGLTASDLEQYGFKLVFSGHYHHHKQLSETVYSVGALAHYTWSDVGHKAGFLVVNNTDVRWYKSHLPAFVEIDGSMDELDIQAVVPGNYVRAKIKIVKQIEIEQFRKYLTDIGAQGVTIIASKPVADVQRANAAVKAGASIESSVTQFITNSPLNSPQLDALCQSILTEARMEVAE
ncbi:metallophosphoesterase [Acinetobacter baumannii]|uniref:Serine/threonine protein phosphatase n=4 Tax=Acinetobacter baumannii TaxID=470 RepID=A0AAP1ADR7_ACIBA|nr:metallophosphoesterase [Acinetobacter baumannii]EMT94604.1 putative exonuclease subunit 1 [Acinetobacter baumannii ABNIH5]ETY66942.1 Ser/Thr phosphatase domain protein [Acinetobacter baumannii MDR_MMC4]EXB15665.1 calcineurin-like phosphoesterase family protein [Acinetobacter baumannii 1397084]EXD24101.1 calcineurin-like phosphoesterase family protein [Acinetobacter baumannii 34654]EYD11787.1 calcineurin-like phosphoesterase family protein [Acinetobacter baumannii 44362_2]EYU47114.1 calcine